MKEINISAGLCLLCGDAPCTGSCAKGLDPARGLRAIRFDNESAAGLYFNREACAGCPAPCETACVLSDKSVLISEIASRLDPVKKIPSADLSIEFCGLKCENPFFLASSAVSTGYEMVARALSQGWGGVFYKTICLEPIREVSPRFDAVRDFQGSFTGFRNMEQLSENPPEEDYRILARLKKDFPSKIIVASIMGQSEEQWIELTEKVQEAGVDAIELNFSCPQMKYAGMGSDVGQNPELVAAYTALVKYHSKVPVIAKMTPNITHIASPTMAAFFSGATGVSAINTIKSVTTSDSSAVSGRKAVSGYSGRAVKPIALRHILEIATNAQLKNAHISGIGGITTWKDALDFIRLGCRNVQVCTAVMEYGYRIIDDLVSGLSSYMVSRGVKHLADIVGEEIPEFVSPSTLDRETVVFPVIDKSLCVGCGRCYISCWDGGHQAISLGEDRKPKINGAKCVGCHLCRLVCPTDAIGISKRVPKVRR